MRQPRLLGAVRLRQRAGPRRPRAGPGRLADGPPPARRWSTATPSRLEGPQITQAARDGDPLSIELLADVGRWLGVGLAGMAAAFDPGCIIIGGGLSDAGELLIGPTRQAFARSLTGRGHRTEPEIVQAALGPNAGFIGAADMARSAARRSRRGRGTPHARGPPASPPVRAP